MAVLSAYSTSDPKEQHPEKDTEISRVETNSAIFKKNYLMQNTVSCDYIGMQNEQLYVLGSGTLREDILTITFLKSMKQASSTDGVCFHLRGKQKFDVKQKTMKQSNGLFQNLTQDLRFFHNLAFPIIWKTENCPRQH